LQKCRRDLSKLYLLKTQKEGRQLHCSIEKQCNIEFIFILLTFFFVEKKKNGKKKVVIRIRSRKILYTNEGKKKVRYLLQVTVER
jgi:hypothetical protein